MPYLDGLIYRTRPVVDVVLGAAGAEKAVYELNLLSTTGTAIFFSAVLTAIWLRIPPGDFCRQFGQTLWQMRWALLTIAAMFAVASVTRYGGTDATLGLVFTKTNRLYPFFAPLLGWLGVALTGSDTSSNALFGSLQRITAQHLHLQPVLIVASNSSGGVMGKMIGAEHCGGGGSHGAVGPGGPDPPLPASPQHNPCLLVGLADAGAGILADVDDSTGTGGARGG